VGGKIYVNLTVGLVTRIIPPQETVSVATPSPLPQALCVEVWWGSGYGLVYTVVVSMATVCSHSNNQYSHSSLRLSAVYNIKVIWMHLMEDNIL
jgi:hypothetical protein